MFNKRFKAIIVSAIFIATLAIGTGSALAQEGLPPFPSDYRGTVYVADVQAGAGLRVTASIGNWSTSEAAITDSSGAYWLGIAPSDPELSGGVIHFYVNGVQASEIAIFNERESVTGFNLHVTAIPTPTATPNVSPTATPGPTPTPISSNASTSIGPSGGTVNTSDGTITITFPAGAFNTSTNVSIQGGACQHGATADFVVGSTCFNISPDGYIDALATICVNLSSTDFSIVTNTEDLTLGYWSNGNWNTTVNVVRNGTVLCGQTAHLSHWAVLGSTVNGTPGATATPTASPTATPSGSQTPAATSSPTPTQTPSGEDEGGTNWTLVGAIVGGVLLMAAIIIAINIRSRGGKGAKPKRKPEQRPGNSKKDEPWDFK
jgi:hypothetical protein